MNRIVFILSIIFLSCTQEADRDLGNKSNAEVGSEQMLLSPTVFTKRSIGEGVGLGLSINHGIIENHNGTIEFGKGRKVVISLPITKTNS